MKKISTNTYVKIIKRDKSEIIAEINFSEWLKEFICKNKFITDKKLDKKNPRWMLSKKDIFYFKGKIPLIEFVNVSVDRIIKMISDNDESLDKMKMTLLACTSEAAYDKIYKNIKDLEFVNLCLKENKLCLDNLLSIIYYELSSRNFFKDNKKILRDNKLKYRADADYDLYFFWK